MAFGAGGRFVGGGAASQRFFLIAETRKPRSARLLRWWAHTDSNRGPKDYERVKSTFLVVSQRLPKKADLARYPEIKGLGVSPWFWVWPVMP